MTGSILIITAPPKLDTTGYQLVENLKVEVYSEAKIKDFIESINGKIITNDKIDTKQLGEQEVRFIYENENGQERMGIMDIDVVDVEKPLIWLSGSYSTEVGQELNLSEEVLCADNYDSNPNCRVEGEYDINTPGTYNLTYVATDSSNNEERINFTLNVYEPAPVEETPEENITEETEQEPVVTAFNEVVEEHKDENTEIGIDVSKWQGEIDFEKVKAAGATFVMIRVGSQQGVGGEYVLDPYFRQNINNAIENQFKSRSIFLFLC